MPRGSRSRARSSGSGARSGTPTAISSASSRNCRSARSSTPGSSRLRTCASIPSPSTASSARSSIKSSASSAAERVKRPPVVGALVVLALATLVGALAWRSRGWPLIHDAPLMHYVAWRIGEGAVPYRDLFDMNFPGVYLIHLTALRLFGAGDGGWRAFDLAWLAGTSLVAAALVAPWGRLAALGAPLFFAVYHLAGGAGQAGQRDFFLCPLLLLAALGVSRWAERPHDRSSLVWGGLAVGAGMTVKPHAGLFAA